MSYRSLDRTNHDAAGGGKHIEEDDDSEGFTIDEAITHIGLGWAHLRIAVVLAFAWMYDGMEIMVITILGQVLTYSWYIDTWQQAFLTMFVFIGWSIGNVAFGKFADTYGRKKSLMLSTSWTLFYGLLSATAPTFTWLLILRGLTGIGIGGAGNVVSFFMEFLPADSRGRGGLFINLQWAVGSTITTLLAMGLVHFSWRYWLVACAMPGVLFLLGLVWIPNSPFYELARGNKEEAREILSVLAIRNGKTLPKGKLRTSQAQSYGDPRKFLLPEYRLTSLLLLIVSAIGGFSYYGIALFATDLVAAGTTCTEGSFVAANSLSEECNFMRKPLNTSDYRELIGTSLSELPAVILGILFIDWIGRKPTLILFQTIQCVLFALLFICMTELPMVIILSALRGLASSTEQCLYVYGTEFYPTDIRMQTVGILMCAGHSLGMFTPYIAQVLFSYSVQAGLAVYTILAGVSSIIFFLLPVETKGRDLALNS